MYLSRVALDTKKKSTLRALASPHHIHKAIEFGFSDRKQRKLWRLDWLGDTCYLLVLAPTKPYFAYLHKEYGFSDQPMYVETKKYMPLVQSLQNDQAWQFRLCANPVRSSASEKSKSGSRGKVFAHVTTKQQKQWLIDRSDKAGFTLNETGFDVINRQWLNFRKGKERSHEVSLSTATYEGILQITDVELFKQALLSGIGRAKAYGCGLLTIASCRSYQS